MTSELRSFDSLNFKFIWTFVPFLKTKFTLYIIMGVKAFVVLDKNVWYRDSLKLDKTLLNHHPYWSSSPGMLWGAVTKSSSASFPTWKCWKFIFAFYFLIMPCYRLSKAAKFFPRSLATLAISMQAEDFELPCWRSRCFGRSTFWTLPFTSSFWSLRRFLLRLTGLELK